MRADSLLYLILGHSCRLVNEVAVQLIGHCLEFLCIIHWSTWLGDIFLLGEVGHVGRFPLLLLDLFVLDIFIVNLREVSRAPDPQHNIIIFLLLNLNINMFKF